MSCEEPWVAAHSTRSHAHTGAFSFSDFTQYVKPTLPGSVMAAWHLHGNKGVLDLWLAVRGFIEMSGLEQKADTLRRNEPPHSLFGGWISSASDIQTTYIYSLCTSGWQSPPFFWGACWRLSIGQVVNLLHVAVWSHSKSTEVTNVCSSLYSACFSMESMSTIPNGTNLS